MRGVAMTMFPWNHGLTCIFPGLAKFGQFNHAYYNLHPPPLGCHSPSSLLDGSSPPLTSQMAPWQYTHKLVLLNKESHCNFTFKHITLHHSVDALPCSVCPWPNLKRQSLATCHVSDSPVHWCLNTEVESLHLSPGKLKLCALSLYNLLLKRTWREPEGPLSMQIRNYELYIATRWPTKQATFV